MKKLKLLVITFIMPITQMVAQPLLSNNEVFDDFSTPNEYVADLGTGRGIYWWDDNSLIAITRNSTTGKLDVVMTQPAYSYTPFGVGFGDDNGALAGGNAFTIDLTNNGTWSFDIENTGTQALSVRVAAQDVNNKMIDCIESPTVIPNANFGAEAWKYQTQIEVPVGQTVTFESGTQNGAGAGIINNCDFANGMWGDYGTHTFRYDYDLSKIKGVNITVLNAEKNLIDFHNLALTDGKFSISNFRVGGTAITSNYNSITELGLDLVIFPNPTSQSISITSKELFNSIQIIDIYGSAIETKTMNGFTNNYTCELTNLNTGVYFVKINDKIQKIVIQ